MFTQNLIPLFSLHTTHRTDPFSCCCEIHKQPAPCEYVCVVSDQVLASLSSYTHQYLPLVHLTLLISCVVCVVCCEKRETSSPSSGPSSSTCMCMVHPHLFFFNNNKSIIYIITTTTMSQHSDDVSSTSGSDSFWEPGNYKRTVRRVEDGFKLCNDMITLIQERSEIEKGYGKSLKTWSKKWSELIEKGPEYGTTEAAWRSMCEEADRICDIHVNVKDRLLNEVVNSIKQWQKDSYHKSMMYLKEKKEFEDNFRKVRF